MRATHARPSTRMLALSGLVFLCALAGAQEIKFATAFTIERGKDYAVATVTAPWKGASGGFTYVFYKRGTAKPAVSRPGAVYFQTPIRSAVTFSASYVAALEALDALDSLTGVDSAAYVYSAKARARIDSGKAREVTKNWAPNVELIMQAAPEAVFTYGMGNEWDSHPKLIEAGLPVVICAEWMEDSPLGRAEWLKFFALFYDKSVQATAAFDAIAQEYQRLKSGVAAIKASASPRVLVNAPFQGTWTVPGGRSYMARLIADAGGDYLWNDDPGTGGLTLSVEAVYERAWNADAWINPGTALSVAELAAIDSRFKSTPALTRGAVFSNTLKSLPSGANDYFESAAFRPQLVLKDLAAIFAAAAEARNARGAPNGAAQEPSSLEYYRILK